MCEREPLRLSRQGPRSGCARVARVCMGAQACVCMHMRVRVRVRALCVWMCVCPQTCSYRALLSAAFARASANCASNMRLCLAAFSSLCIPGRGGKTPLKHTPMPASSSYARTYTHTFSLSLFLSHTHMHTFTRTHLFLSHTHSHTLMHTHTRTQIHVHSCTTQLRPFRQALVSAPCTGHTHEGQHRPQRQGPAPATLGKSRAAGALRHARTHTHGTPLGPPGLACRAHGWDTSTPSA